MKRFFTLVFCLVACLLSLGQTPRMTVRQTDGSLKTLVITEADIQIRILGDVAETAIELDFRNDGDRAVEGEFALTLPAGATVSGYALEVNGAMRAAVSVEKERARTAYETVKRRLIDPGLVEREAGNIYRTKVYPVPAKGTKRLRISYTEILDEDPPIYSLPLDFPDPLALFKLKIEGENLNVTDSAGVTFEENKNGEFRAEMKAFKPTRTLRIAMGKLPEDLIFVDNGAQPAFLLSTMPPDLAPRARPTPKSVAIIWDASRSGMGRDYASELALLDAWFQQLGEVGIELFTLRNTLQSVGNYEVRDGKWMDLRKKLEDIDYDGATDFSQIRLTAEQADLVLLFSDGVASIGANPPEIASPWFFIRHQGTTATRPLVHLAVASGGGEITVSDPIKSALEKLTQISPRLISLTSNGSHEIPFEKTLATGHRLHVFGISPAADLNDLKLGYGYQNEITHTQKVSATSVEKSGGIIRRLHAQSILAKMEKQFSSDRAAIIAHCKREGLVSDFTSLIVLERLEDYAEHGIRPPEKELWEEYEKLVADFVAKRTTRWTAASWAWSRKRSWYGTAFPGYEAGILPRLKQVGIWKNAVESQFKPEQRDTAAFGAIAIWYEKGIALLEQIPKIQSAQEYQDWQQGIDDLRTQGTKLAETPLHAPPAGKELAVSIRGLVAEPGVITSKNPLTLRSAIEEAGGLHPFGSLDNIALYRNAGKVVYNALSERFEDFPLFPMDMVVIRMKDDDDYGDMDPFADFGGVPLSASQKGPIREQNDVWIRPNLSRDPFGTLGANSAEGAGNAEIRNIVLPDNFSEKPLDIAKFEKQLAAGGEPETTYKKHRGAHTHTEKFYIEAARILFSKKQDFLAAQVLSNLAEMRPDDVSAQRAWAFWLAEFDKTDDAQKVLKGIPPDHATDFLIVRDLAKIRASRDNFENAYSEWARSIGNIVDHGNFAAIALTEFNHLRSNARGNRNTEPFPSYQADFSQELPADIRIVLTSADDSSFHDLAVTEPDGNQCTKHSTESPSGGRIITSHGISEYMIRRALPGTYRIHLHTKSPATVRATIDTDWSRPNQKSQNITVFADSEKFETIAELEFGFRATK